MDINTLIFVVVAILLPLLPAMLLYKFLPSKTRVQGPFQGFRINLGGSFAGYFLLVVMIFGFYEINSSCPCELWTIRGDIELGDRGETPEDTRIFLVPENYFVRRDGKFEIVVPTRPTHGDDTRLPALVFEHSGYRHVTIDPEQELANDRGSKQKTVRQITLTETFTLQKEPVEKYDPTAEPLRQK
ncbi:MAG: hypothetical protein GY835_22395 [bacterium]|nr:hypothetical protein [bacterium]